jgi:hypothetical protein
VGDDDVSAPAPNMPPLDSSQRRVLSLFYDGFNWAYPRRPNREFENVCPECEGDGCAPCKWTGEKA